MSDKDYVKNQKNRIKQLLIKFNGNLLDVQMHIYVEARVDVEIEEIHKLLDSKSFESVRNTISYNKLRSIEDKLFGLAMKNNLKAIELYLKRVDEKSTNKNSDIQINLKIPKDLREINDKRDENECSEK